MDSSNPIQFKLSLEGLPELVFTTSNDLSADANGMLEHIRDKLTSEGKELILNLTERVDEFHFGIEPLVKDKNTKSASRFVDDFRDRGEIGLGGYGRVFLCTHGIDGIEYAVKRIPLEADFEKILREAKALSRLQHQHVVRYYQLTSEGKELILNLTERADEFHIGIEPLVKDNDTKSASRFVRDFCDWGEIGKASCFSV